MSEAASRQYEAMFLFDPTFGSSFGDCEAEIRRLMERAEARILLRRMWDERRLAYRIRGRKRGVYVLVYFEASPAKLRPLERDAQLSENILRLLVVRAEGVTPETMKAAAEAHIRQPADERAKSEPTTEVPAEVKEAEPVKAAAEAGEGALTTETAVAEGSNDDTATETESSIRE